MCAENWTPGETTIDAARELGPGSIISSYRIEERIGDGGFASVFRAHDRVLQRTVALKILKRKGERAPSIQHEARAAAALNHPNVCTVYSIAESEGVPMIVMEYLPGRSLKSNIADGPMPPDRVARIVGQIAAGMAAAHDAGISHGDLKPANIMLDVQDNVKILDFGLAARDDPSESTVYLRIAVAGPVAGTPSYMSPEQADGRSADVPSDVFSLGLIIYELLTGHRAFSERDVLKVLSRIRSIDPAQFADHVVQPFDTLLRQMLARDPTKRTVTMHDVEETLKPLRSFDDP